MEMQSLGLVGAFNFRDLGGYEALDGSTVRTGVLFRSDDLARLTEADLDIFGALGIRLVIDLRTPEEVESRGSFTDHGHTAAYINLPLMDISASPREPRESERYLVDRYRQILIEGAPQFVKVLDRLSNSEAVPAVFHCAVGKDRTGLIAMLCLGLLGVSDEQIAFDYSLTTQSVATLIEWLEREHPEVAETVKSLPKAMMSSNASTMLETISWLKAGFGSFEGYAAYAGIPARQVSQLRQLLLR